MIATTASLRSNRVECLRGVMALAPGTRLGPYEIGAQIGAGGMGEVYRAKDTSLGRDVAIKVLPNAFAQDAERLARFEREAKTLASLSHPNIAIVHGFEKADSVRALVMEFVEGETLAERIGRGPIAVDDALLIARQMAEALEAAHEHGIVHRDLKPANIKLRTDGTVKVLDFGLAKAVEPAAAGITATESPTITSPAMMTGVGIILGTAAYMCPEQARGKKTDYRADIWSFGVVLYEMVIGKRLFEGEDVTDTIASVVKQHPDLTAVPREVRKVVEACLKKDPRQRLQAIADWKLLVADADADTSLQAELRSARLPWFAAFAAALALAALAFVHFREVLPEERVVRLSVTPPDNSQVGFLELSPDGRRLLLVASAEGRSQIQQIHLRSLDSPEWTLLAGTNNARTPFWSPDSRSIGFFADGRLKVISAAGGPAQVLCSETGLGYGGTWNHDDVILFATDRGRLRRVNAKGGECHPVGNDDLKYRARLPVFLPDGRHFFYIGLPGDSSAGVYLGTLDDFPGRRLLPDISSVVYTPAASGRSAHLLFLRASTLMAQPFDHATLQTVGDPFAVAEQASTTFTASQVAASAAADGTLVYLAGRSTEAQLTWLDRNGKELGKVGPRANQSGVALSPDGNAVVVHRRDRSNEPGLWLHDLVRGSESRLMPPGSPGGGGAQWSPDGSRIWFGMGPAAPEGPGVYQKDIKSGSLELVRKRDPTGPPAATSDWSRDGRFLIYTVADPKTRADIWYLPLASGKPDGEVVRLLATDAGESQGQVSRDGRWLAYTSNESGALEVYIRAFPSGEGVWRVSVDGGREPRWRADGRELFFMMGGPDRMALFAVAIMPDGRGGLRIGSPQRLFDVAVVSIVPQDNIFAYSPHPDGERFLVNALADTGEQTVNVITNWQKTVPAR